MATMAVASEKAGTVERVALRRVPLATVVALVIGISANVALYLIGRATGAIAAEVPLSNGQVFGLAPVVAITVVSAIGGAIVYAILGAIRRLRRPITVYRIVALGVLILSFLSPFSVPDASAGFIIFLELMHVAAAAAIVWSLTTLAGERG